MDDKVRLDIVLREKFGFSRERAKEAIEKGYVSFNGKIFCKPGEKVSPDTEIEIDEKGFLKYVGRGGLKLEKAIEVFGINMSGKICIDVGSSTGGFTDCMLKYGAEKIYAVDVGKGQLADVIRDNPKVVSFENTNITSLTKDDFSLSIDFASVDVSFVSLTKILSYVRDILSENGEAVALIKPQFEAGRQNISRKGIVKNFKVHKNVIKTIFIYASEIGFNIKNLSFSPIKGSDGNIEYIFYISKNGSSIKFSDFDSIIDNVIFEAGRVL